MCEFMFHVLATPLKGFRCTMKRKVIECVRCACCFCWHCVRNCGIFSRFRFCHHFALIDACSEVWLCVASILFASCHERLMRESTWRERQRMYRSNTVKWETQKMQNGMACALAYRESNRIIIWGIQFAIINEMLCTFVNPKIMFPLIAFA